LAAIAILEAIRRIPALDVAEIEDIILGCAMPEAESGHECCANCRAASRATRGNSRDYGEPVLFLRIAIHAMAAERIMAGHADVILAGGTESMSLFRWAETKFRRIHG